MNDPRTSVLRALRRRLAPRSRTLAIFNHIPKTGGMSFHEFINRNVPDGTVLELYTIDNRDRLVALSRHEQSQLHAVVGHLPFSYFRTFKPAKPTEHITVLREPIERIISFYHYITRHQTHYLHDKIVQGSLSLHDFVQQRLTLECDNLQVRYLCSDDLSGVAIGACTPQMLEQAKDNIASRFAAIGITEQFDDTLRLVAKAFDWRHVQSPQINVAPKVNKDAPCSAETRALIASTNELDLELYEFGKQLFNQRLAALGPQS